MIDPLLRTKDPHRLLSHDAVFYFAKSVLEPHDARWEVEREILNSEGLGKLIIRKSDHCGVHRNPFTLVYKLKGGKESEERIRYELKQYAMAYEVKHGY